MINLLLKLHIVSAIIVWSISVYSFYAYSSISNRNLLITLRRLLITGLASSSLLGFAFALSKGNLSLGVCAKIGLYMAPVLLATYLMQAKINAMNRLIVEEHES